MTFDASTSSATTRWPASANATARGSPTYPSPTMPTLAPVCAFFIRHCLLQLTWVIPTINVRRVGSSAAPDLLGGSRTPAHIHAFPPVDTA